MCIIPFNRLPPRLPNLILPLPVQILHEPRYVTYYQRIFNLFLNLSSSSSFLFINGAATVFKLRVLLHHEHQSDDLSLALSLGYVQGGRPEGGLEVEVGLSASSKNMLDTFNLAFLDGNIECGLLAAGHTCHVYVRSSDELLDQRD